MTDDAGRVLVVDDERNILTSLKRALELEDYAVDVAGNIALGKERLLASDYDLALLDVNLPDGTGLELLDWINTHDDPPAVIMMSGHGSTDLAVDATKRGAFSFIDKPIGIDLLLVTLTNAQRAAELEAENAALRTSLGQNQELLGDSQPMQHLRDLVARVGRSNAATLILGERGTGKELVARALHQASERRDASYETLNCAAVPTNLIESELFGHNAGAFTGATKARKGKFERAHGGTLFLDEVADMPEPMQAKLLRVLQEGQLERVGGEGSISVDVRVIAATNKDLSSAVDEGKFRADLYDRLNVVPIHLPPLRNRNGDIAALATHFLPIACARHNRKAMTFTADALQAFETHTYPGNVRELSNLIERLVILAPKNEIDAADVTAHLPNRARPRPEATYDPSISLKMAAETAEREFISAALSFHDNHMTRTAEALGLERSHLYKKMKALGLRD